MDFQYQGLESRRGKEERESVGGEGGGGRRRQIDGGFVDWLVYHLSSLAAGARSATQRQGIIQMSGGRSGQNPRWRGW